MGICRALHCFIVISILVDCFNPIDMAMSVAMVENTKKVVKNMCMNKTKVKSSVLAAMKTGQFADDRNLKCYMSCALTFMKVLQKDKINYESASKQIESQLPASMRPPFIKGLNACKDVGGADGCEVAYNFITCSYEATNEVLVPI